MERTALFLGGTGLGLLREVFYVFPIIFQKVGIMGHRTDRTLALPPPPLPSRVCACAGGLGAAGLLRPAL